MSKPETVTAPPGAHSFIHARPPAEFEPIMQGGNILTALPEVGLFCKADKVGRLGKGRLCDCGRYRVFWP